MVSKTMVIKAEEGLHMRPAGAIAREAGKFDADVTIVMGDKRINAKSLVNIIAACIKKDAEITFECDGPDEEAALAKMEELEAENFGD
ncbi:MAG: HPr family phosphocarrier protein [Lachnobacterium sp.]|nr:HPr family phosphocarrier protein [Lachnobacterium sp.]MDD6632435.1 HPr family phosphocarrier protein [Lachnobacterium sp.]MDY2911500.1 HPr family phosphocarrier protein [Agathobacter sp.]